MKVEIQNAAGRPVDSLSSDVALPPSDEIDRTVTWNGSPDVSSLAGTVIRLRITLSDGDLYAFKFS